MTRSDGASSRPVLYSARARALRAHYEAFWGPATAVVAWPAGPAAELPPDFHVLEFPPGTRKRWTYATCCMSQPSDAKGIELHLLSPVQHGGHIELLTAVAHYHRTGRSIGLGHTVNFGRPWFPNSACDHGLLSLPYLDGPALERCELPGETVHCLWLIPITAAEVEFAVAGGLERLEQRFEAGKLDYLDPERRSLV
jgi:hypothetical protein